VPIPQGTQPTNNLKSHGKQTMMTHTQPQTMIGMLVVDNDISVFEKIKSLLPENDSIYHASNSKQAYPLLKQIEIGILVCNEYLGDENGLQFMGRINKEFPLLQPILMSEGIDEDLLDIAINEVGVLKYLKKPLNLTQVSKALTSANQHYLKAVETEALKESYSNALETMNSLPYMARRARQTTRILLHNSSELTAAAGISVAIILGIFFVLGTLFFMLLYIMKSLFGINLFSDSHLSDILGMSM